MNGASAAAIEITADRVVLSSGETFADNLDHLRALEREATLMLALAVRRRCARGGSGDESAWAEYRLHFPLLPAEVDPVTMRELLLETAAANRRNEAVAGQRGVTLNFVAFCSEWGLDRTECAIVLLLLMQYTAPGFQRIMEKCDLTKFRSTTGIGIGALLQVLGEDFREQVAMRRHFSVDATLMKSDIVLCLDSADDTTNILDIPVSLHERVVRFVLGDRNVYHSAFRFVRREQGNVSLAQVVMPDDQKEEIVACVSRYLSGRAEGTLDSFDTFYGYGTCLAFIFHGPSGTGKTMLARALASRFGRQLITISPDHSRRHVGFDEMLAIVFREAEMDGGIVLLDECDDLLVNNSDASQALLIELEKARCVVILATNKLVGLDPALERRIAMKVRFRIPDTGMRLRLWNSLLPRNVDLAGDVDLSVIAERYQFSGGLIKNCLLLAAMQAEVVVGGRRRVSRAHLERAAALQQPSTADGGNLFTQYAPATTMETLPLRAADRERLAGAARAWGRLKADGLGLCVLIRASDVDAGIRAAEALAGACALEVRKYSFGTLQGELFENWPVDPLTQMKIHPMSYAFAQSLGISAATLFVDRVGDFSSMFSGDVKAAEAVLTNSLHSYSGLFCLVASCLKPVVLPPEFHLHLDLAHPTEEVQMRRWEERLGAGTLREGDLVAVVERWPMHVGEIDRLSRHATVLSLVRGGSGRPGLDEVLEVIGRSRRSAKAPVLFGGG